MVEFHKGEFRKVEFRVRRVNFEFGNPVEIRKGCEFEDREL